MTIVRSVLVCCLMLSLGCQERKTQQTPGSQKPPTAVEALRVTEGKVTRVVDAAGVAAGIREAYVLSETQGTIRGVHFVLGQKVEDGQLLVQVDDAIQRTSLQQARKAAAAAELHLNVTERLFEDGDASEAELTGAQTQASGARAQLESAQKAYEDCRISAPISGYIAQKAQTMETGNLLAGGSLVTRIVDISSLKATVAVGEMEVGILKTGLKAHIRVPAVQDARFEGMVTAIAAGSDPSTGSYPVEVQWENTPDKRVRSGMSVHVRIETEEPDAVIVIPAKAIVEKEGKKAVFVASRNRAAIRFVEMGDVFGDLAEIVEGLEVGDILLTSGITTLRRGEPIAVTVTGRSGGMP